MLVKNAPHGVAKKSPDLSSGVGLRGSRYWEGEAALLETLDEFRYVSNYSDGASSITLVVSTA